MSSIREDCVAEIKTRVNLGVVVSRLVALKGKEDELIGLCPLHNEKTPSFHVHPVRGFYKCFGCGKSGDAISFVRETENLDFVQAIEALGSRFNIPIFYDDGARAADGAAPTPFQRPKPIIETRAPSDTWLRLQSKMRPGTLADIRQVGELRKIPSLAGLELATRHGQLWFADVWDDGFDWPAWLITDAARRNAQARRMDGKPWSGIGGKKAKTIKDCEATWPVGITEAAKHPEIFLVEGGPDFLAAWHLIWMIEKVGIAAPAAMFGAANPIHDAALPLFVGKDVRIFPHNDPDMTGMKGAIRWRAQLLEAGARTVDYFDFRPEGNKDLNEMITKIGIPELREVV